MGFMGTTARNPIARSREDAVTILYLRVDGGLLAGI